MLMAQSLCLETLKYLFDFSMNIIGHLPWWFTRTEWNSDSLHTIESYSSTDSALADDIM